MKVSNFGFMSSLCGTILGIGFYIRERNGGKKYTYETDAVKNKLVIVTGATSGIGKALAKELALRKAKVILACRDMEECESVAFKLRYAARNKAIACKELDLASQESIRNFVNEFSKKHQKLDILVNNAAVMAPPRQLTKDGIELQLGVNHMGPFLLTNLLLPHLKAAAPSRIVNVTSIDYKTATINKEDLNSVKSYDPMEAYKQSKLANILFTLELAKKLKGTGVTVNAAYPGITQTKLMRHTSYYSSWVSTLFVKPFMWLFIKHPKHGSQPILYTAIEPEIKDVSGVLFGHNFVQENIEVPKHEDENIQKWIWDVSAKWTKLNLKS